MLRSFFIDTRKLEKEREYDNLVSIKRKRAPLRPLEGKFIKSEIVIPKNPNVVDEIDDNHVRQIAIPLLKDRAVQKHINELALGANKKRYEAYCLEQEALRIMNEEVILAK